MQKEWLEMFEKARRIISPKEVSPFITYGNHSCAILTSSKNIYTSVNILSSLDISSTAEKNAITQMLNNGEHKIEKMLLLNELEEIILPSQDCFEYLVELCDDVNDIEILTDLNNFKSIKLSELLPNWWGTFREKKN